MFFTLYLYLRQIGVIKKDIKVIEIANLTQQNEYRGGELRPFKIYRSITKHKKSNCVF
jgi:hypothetical protein